MAERIVERALGDTRLAAVLYALLDDLREWVRVYGNTPEADKHSGDYSVEWATSVTEDGPLKVLLEAIAANPELWLPSLPKGVVLAPRSLVKSLLDAMPPHPMSLPSADALDSLHHAGLAIVEHAAHAQRQVEGFSDDDIAAIREQESKRQ